MSRVVGRQAGRLVIAVGLTLFWLAGLSARPAAAHANLIRSQPAVGAILTAAPPDSWVEYTEAVDPGLVDIRLADAAGVTLADNIGRPDAADPNRVQLSLPPLTDGAYTIIWRVRSAVDGHITQGAVPFVIGRAPLPENLLPPPGVRPPALALPPIEEGVARAVGYVAAAVGVGSLGLGVAVWRPAWRAWATPSLPNDVEASRRLRRLSVMGLLSWLAATIGLALLQAQAASSLGQLGDGLAAWVGSRQAALAGIRLVGLVVLIGGVQRLRPAGHSSGRAWLWALGGGLALLWTFPLQSHAPTVPGAGGVWATALDGVHVMATALWLGGLPALAYLLARPADATPPRLVPAFSRLALISVTCLALTGVYSAWVHVRTPAALTATSYGRLVGIKTLLFGLLILLGAVNLLVISPRLTQAADQARLWLRRVVGLELLSGLVLLGVVGALMGTAPAFEALANQQRQGFLAQAREGGVQLTLAVAPGQVGENLFGVDVADERPGAANAPARVTLRLQPRQVSLGLIEVDTTTVDQQRFVARGSYLALADSWEVTVIVRRDGFQNVSQRFEVAIPTAPADP